MATQLGQEIRRILLDAKDPKGPVYIYLTAHQILNRLPASIREPFIQKRGGVGLGSGASSSPTRDIGIAIEAMDNEIERAVFDARGAVFEVAALSVPAGYPLIAFTGSARTSRATRWERADDRGEQRSKSPRAVEPSIPASVPVVPPIPAIMALRCVLLRRRSRRPIAPNLFTINNFRGKRRAPGDRHRPSFRDRLESAHADSVQGRSVRS